MHFTDDTVRSHGCGCGSSRAGGSPLATHEQQDHRTACCGQPSAQAEAPQAKENQNHRCCGGKGRKAPAS